MTVPYILTTQGWRRFNSGFVRKGAEWRRITKGMIYTSAGWKTFADFTPPMSIVLSPSPAVTTFRPPSTTSAYITSPEVNVVITGGDAPYTYTWTLVSGVVTIFSPNSAATEFGATVEPFEVVSAVAKVTVRDANGTVATATVNITLRNSPTV